jgi:hypothetical protein
VVTISRCVKRIGSVGFVIFPSFNPFTDEDGYSEQNCYHKGRYADPYSHLKLVNARLGGHLYKVLKD